MRFHRSLLVLTAINFISCVIVFSALYKSLSPDERIGNVYLGWIAWLGILCIGPNLFSNATRRQWFNKQYGPGTILLLLVNVIAAIAGNALANILVK